MGIVMKYHSLFIIASQNNKHSRLRKKSNFCVALHPSSLRRIVTKPHSSGFARLEFETFYFVARFLTFYWTIKLKINLVRKKFLRSTVKFYIMKSLRRKILTGKSRGSDCSTNPINGGVSLHARFYSEGWSVYVSHNCLFRTFPGHIS